MLKIWREKDKIVKVEEKKLKKRRGNKLKIKIIYWREKGRKGEKVGESKSRKKKMEKMEKGKENSRKRNEKR